MSAERQKQCVLGGLLVVLVAAGGMYWIRGDGDAVQGAAQVDSSGRRMRPVDTPASVQPRIIRCPVIEEEAPERPYRTADEEEPDGRRKRDQGDEDLKKTKLVRAS